MTGIGGKISSANKKEYKNWFLGKTGKGHPTTQQSFFTLFVSFSEGDLWHVAFPSKICQYSMQFSKFIMKIYIVLQGDEWEGREGFHPPPKGRILYSIESTVRCNWVCRAGNTDIITVFKTISFQSATGYFQSYKPVWFQLRNLLRFTKLFFFSKFQQHGFISLWQCTKKSGR